MAYTLRDYQQYGVNETLDYYMSGGKENGIIVMPTGTGKSLVIAEIVKRVCGTWPGTRIMMLTHVKELVEQNYAKLLEHWPMAPAGVYSAGIGRKEDHFPITFGGIQSVVKNVHKFGRIDILFVDECHRMSPNAGTSYMKVIDLLKKVNPNLVVIGLTATPYRLKGGELTDTPMFDRILVDMSKLEVFNWFLEQGYLAYLKPYVPSVEIDLTGVGKSGGDYNQGDLQSASDKEWITKQAVAEMAQAAEDQGRRHWLVFGTGVDHVEHIVTEIQSQGYTAVAVHSKMSTAQRDENIQLFLDGHVTALVNMGVLTTGFDAPFTDLIGMLRATTSASLWVQMLGRGTRPYYERGFDLSTADGRLGAIAASTKPDCLVLDFAGNTKRLGCINDPVVPTKKKKGKGEAPVRDCPSCHFLMHASLRTCPQCGEEFPPETKFDGKSASDELIAKKRKEKEPPEVHVFKVDSVFFKAKQGRAGKPAYVEASYHCGLRRFTQPLCFEHEQYALKKARDWWRKATGNDEGNNVPTTVGEALQRQGECKTPTHIRVWVNKKYPEILNIDYKGELEHGTEQRGIQFDASTALRAK